MTKTSIRTRTKARMKPRAAKDWRREELRQLGEKIRAHRHRRALTQEDLAGAIRLSVAYVSLIERGERNPPYTTVIAIARALGVAPGRIVAGG